MKEFPKKLDPSSFESKWYETWKKNKIYLKQNKNKKPYSILMPPPNVTGILHFGHVLNHTLQDIYIRRHRMLGYDAQWFPGMDHAGIATQARVEKMLKEEHNQTRYDLGREKFIEKVLEWKEKYGGIIFSQLEKLGVSANWDKLLFTMDQKASEAVRDVFIKLFDEGLIYRGKRIINWSPVSMTALSDEEVDWKEVNEKIYTLRYKFENSEKYLQVATVRPETIFGDVAIAVNPKDGRFAEYIGKKVIVPFVGRAIPIITDDYADPDFGTGCVKITPAHDPNDFEVGERHNLEKINTINPDGTMNDLAGILNGIERFKARKVIMQELEKAELVEKVEDYTHNVGFSQRGGEPIEPYLSDQWFVKMKPMAKIALDAVKDDSIKFHPPHWMKTYTHWMDNIRDWCISRQLWWGHRIPIYYTEDGRQAAAKNEEEARAKLDLDINTKLKQDPDVLDTWFSSWLWPMTTMNWDSTNQENSDDDFARYLPTNLLVTGPDIIFFWVARMIMATKKFSNTIPFSDVYFTSMIRDGKGFKLSKSLGNSPDPLKIIDKYGADATRFTMIYLAPLGQDVRMDVDVEAQDIPSIDIGKNFANKIFNACRFLSMKFNEAGDTRAELSQSSKSLADRWIESRLNNTIKEASKAIDSFNVTVYSKLLYDFIWRDYCSWYVEIVKTQFSNNENEQYRQALTTFSIDIFDKVLKMLHPVMPFITEELWHLINDVDDNESISLQETPKENSEKISTNIENEFNIVTELIEKIRQMRASSNLKPSEKVEAFISSIKDKVVESVISNSEVNQLVVSICNLSSFRMSGNIELKHSANDVFRACKLTLELPEKSEEDIAAEMERLQKEAQRLEKQIAGIQKKLSNERFVNNAPKEVVEMEQKKLDDMNANLLKIKENL
ncbi:valine--tRNA ligase [Candidatus Kapabacteria bacterium]|nr:valine--tRNA ligase [Candidatus Kapabacteria bacterium]